MNTSHSRPDTPGWQSLVTLATDFVSEGCGRETSRLLAMNLEVRKSEKIPDDHFDDTMRAVFSAAMISADRIEDVELPGLAMEFFNAQMGREAFTALAAEFAPDWEVIDQPSNSVGYTLYTTDRERMRKHMQRDREREQMESLFGSLFGFGGHSIVMVGGGPGRKQPDNEGSETDPNKKVEEPESVAQTA